MRLRSVLFVPGSRPDRFEKARAAGADLTCVDLEDAVAPDAKNAARADVLAALAEAPGAFGVRVNSPRTAWGCADLAALAAAPAAPAFVMLAKAEHAVDVEIAAEVLGEDAPPLFPLIESARALHDAPAIAGAPRVAALVFGGGDFSADLGVALEWEPLLYARSAIVAAAAAAGVAAIDVPHLDVRDEAGLSASTDRVRALGFSGRLCIHPAQVAPVNAAFAPSREEIASAERVIEALATAGGGAALLDGKLIEEPVARAARRTLELAEAGGADA